MKPSEKDREPSYQAAQRVHVRTFGCQMNVYDSERMGEILTPLGYVRADRAEDADLVILNTCHIREKAAEKLYSDLGRLKEVRVDRQMRGDRGMTIAVAGCVAQAEGAEILRRAPQVDLVVGPQSYHSLPELLAKVARSETGIVETEFAVTEKFDRLGAHRGAQSGPAAFLTIQEGCDKFCSFCVVPYTRGAEVSRPFDALLAETEVLVARGVRELTLLGQNVNAWRGKDGSGASLGLGTLCRRLAAVNGLERLRFTTSHPRDMDAELIAALSEEPKLMPYLHLPVQSGSDRILKAMNRGHTVREYLDLVARIRAARPDIALSSDFIVGYPGENEEDFLDTAALVEAVGFASSFSFKYSRRPGTPAATAAEQIDESVKEDRLQRLNNLLDAQRRAFNRSQIGRELPVLFEKLGRRPGQLIGRTPYLQSLHAEAPASMIGAIERVVVTGVTPNALSGAVMSQRI